MGVFPRVVQQKRTERPFLPLKRPHANGHVLYTLEFAGFKGIPGVSGGGRVQHTRHTRSGGQPTRTL